MDKKFIYTTSKETVEILRKKGLVEVFQSASGWTFINDKTIHFSLNDNTIYTNKVCV